LDWTFISQVPQQPTLFQQDQIGGVGNAIVGSLVIDGVAALFAVPLGVVLGLYLSESDTRWANGLRRVTEIMTGLPSILLGIFAYIYVVTNMQSFSGFAGAVALALLMTPVITKAAETALRAVPTTLTEAGLALGARQSKVSMRVVLPVAMPGIITGVLLALARAVGETAPLLFVIGASIRYDWNPFHVMAALPLMTYNYSSAAYDSQHHAAWGIGLLLVIIVLILNASARLIAAFMRRERH
jgi:phosphate transport system permease protein